MLAKIKTMNGARTPQYQTPESSGMDLRAIENLWIQPKETIAVSTGLMISLPANLEAQIRSRSGLAQQGIVVANSPGTVDSDYRGEIKVLLHNQSEYTFDIHKGDRIAQIVISPVTRIVWNQVLELDDTERGAGGLGSTGTT